MTLENWLKKNNVTMKEFCGRVGCGRTILWKVKTGKTVDKKIAAKILEETNGEVFAMSRARGRPRVYDETTGKYLL